MRRSFLVLFLLFIMLPIAAQTVPTEVEKILLPLTLEVPLPGAFGSLWKTHLSITNGAAAPVLIEGYEWDPELCINGPGQCGPVPKTPVGVTFYPGVFDFTDEVQGYFLTVEKDQAASVQVQLRLQDLSRQSEDFGTEIPVVRESEAFTAAFQLLDVPIRSELRSMLRVYDFAPAVGHSVRVRVFRVQPTQVAPFRLAIARPADELLFDRTMAFRVTSSGTTTRHPGYLEMNLSAVTELAGAERVRVELSPDGGSTRLWGFVSSTNNVTQHVTLVSPR